MLQGREHCCCVVGVVAGAMHPSKPHATRAPHLSLNNMTAHLCSCMLGSSAPVTWAGPPVLHRERLQVKSFEPRATALHSVYGKPQLQLLSCCRAPQLAEVGEVGGEAWLEMELRLVADVGLVGAPNAGKSTLLSTLSAARPKVADYPFTTLTPNLGVCDLDFRSTVIADIPGRSQSCAAWMETW